MSEEYIKFISFNFDPNDINNPIKPTNYVNPNFKYEVSELWPEFLNYYPLRCSGCILEEFEPIQRYIINQYESGEYIREIVRKLVSSYFNNLDSYHKDLIFEAVEYGHRYNNLRYLDEWEGMNTKMFKFFAELIHEPARGLGYSTNPQCYQILKENRSFFTNVEKDLV